MTTPPRNETRNKRAPLLADAFRRNPFPVYAAMRRFAPVFHHKRRRVRLLFDYDSVTRALHEIDVFSSRAAPPGGQPLDWLIFLDPPRHSKMRGMVMRTFTPRAIAGLEPRIVERVDALLDRALSGNTFDLVAALAEPLPLMVIGDLLGVPSGDERRLRRWAAAILGLGETIHGGDVAARAAANFRTAQEEMRPYVDTLVGARRAEPQDDLLTRLGQESLTADEIFGFFQLLLLAGSETTTNLIGNSVVALLDHPRELAKVRANPDLLPSAIEEVLRFRSPVQLVFRQTTREVVVRGKTIPSNALVLAVIGSANRDAKKFRDPQRFDITRTPNDHIAFGHGAHFCIGAALARLEARIVLARLLERVPDLRYARRRAWTARPGLNVHGPAELWVGTSFAQSATR